MINGEKYVVVPDLHGHDELLMATHKKYGDSVGYLVLGDVFDGTDRVRQTMDAILDIGAKLLIGNHEWVTLAAIYERNKQSRSIWQDGVWRPSAGGGYHDKVLESYGVSPEGLNRTRAARLGQMLFKAGHLDELQSAALYYEDDDIIGVHAGLTDEPWEQQKQRLDRMMQKKIVCDFSDEPEQLFSHALANDSGQKQCIDGRTLITGHSSLVLTEEQRISANGKRVRLGSRVRSGAPIYVWENWTRQVRAISAEQ